MHTLPLVTGEVPVAKAPPSPCSSMSRVHQVNRPAGEPVSDEIDFILGLTCPIDGPDRESVLLGHHLGQGEAVSQDVLATAPKRWAIMTDGLYKMRQTRFWRQRPSSCSTRTLGLTSEIGQKPRTSIGGAFLL